MRKIFLGAFIALVSVTTAHAGDVPVANPPPLKAEPLTGDSKTAGMFISRMHLPAEALVKPHFHDADRYISVITGTLYVCNSSTVSAATVTAHKAGEVFKEPGQQVHCSWAKEGPVEYLEIGVGPQGMTFVDK